jgi:hypothetical protein
LQGDVLVEYRQKICQGKILEAYRRAMTRNAIGFTKINNWRVQLSSIDHKRARTDVATDE